MKILNTKIEFSACGRYMTMRLSDDELRQLRRSSNNWAGVDVSSMTCGFIYNFAIYALFDYSFKSASKRRRFMDTYGYNDFGEMYWSVV